MMERKISGSRISNQPTAEPHRFLIYLNKKRIIKNSLNADVAELVDAQVSEACCRKAVEVRFFSSAPYRLAGANESEGPVVCDSGLCPFWTDPKNFDPI